MEEGSGWPLGLEPIHFRRRVLETARMSAGTKISTSSSAEESSNLESQSSSSSKFFPGDRPVTLGEILGMSLNQLASTSFRSIELHVLQPRSRRNHGPSNGAAVTTKRRWGLILSCTCAKDCTSSNRFQDEVDSCTSDSSSSGQMLDDSGVFVEKIYTNSIFEEDPLPQQTAGLDHTVCCRQSFDFVGEGGCGSPDLDVSSKGGGNHHHGH